MKFLFKVGKKIYTGIDMIDLLHALTGRSKTDLKRINEAGGIDTWINFDDPVKITHQGDQLQIVADRE